MKIHALVDAIDTVFQPLQNFINLAFAGCRFNGKTVIRDRNAYPSEYGIVPR